MNHEEWLTTVKPDLAPALAARTKLALETSSNLVPLLQKIKDETRYAISELLKVICMILKNKVRFCITDTLSRFLFR